MKTWLPMPKRAPLLTLRLSLGCGRAGVPASRSMQAWAQAAISAAAASNAAASRGWAPQLGLSVRVCDLIEAKASNAQYRGKDYATNVLSFPADAMPGERQDWLGDLLLCHAVLVREAGQRVIVTTPGFANANGLALASGVRVRE